MLILKKSSCRDIGYETIAFLYRINLCFMYFPRIVLYDLRHSAYYLPYHNFAPLQENMHILYRRLEKM